MSEGEGAGGLTSPQLFSEVEERYGRVGRGAPALGGGAAPPGAAVWGSG